MATYYVELNGGELSPKTTLKGGGLVPSVSFAGAVIYPTSGGGGGANLETKSVSYTPSETAISDTLLPDPGYDGFDEVDVSVDAIPSNYVGSGVPRRDSLDPTTSGATVKVPSGFYEYNSSATIPSAPLPTISSATIDSSGNLGVTANLSGDGYLQSGTLPLTLTNAFTVQGAQTITPTTTDQTISADQYLTGNQTILGDADLVASNIKKDVEIFGVTGTYEGGGGGGSWTEQTIATSGAVSQALDEFVWYHFTGSLTSLTITLNTPSDPQYANYRFDFNSGNPAVTLSLPNTIAMPTDFSVELLRKYQIDILGTTATVSKTWNRYRYSTTDGTLFYGKGAPPGGGGTNWKVIASNGLRSLFALYESEIGGIDVLPWGSDTTSFPDYGTVIYPIPIPTDAVGFRVTIPNRRIGPSFWRFTATGNMIRSSDPGWQSNVGGVVTYAFTQGAYQYLLCNVDSGTLESSATLEFLTN